MIKYIEHKKIDYEKVKLFLEKSEQSNMLTNRGPAKFELEKKLSEVLGISKNKRVVCVANGTLALHSIYFYLLKKYKNKVKFVTPSFTFPSSVVGLFKTNVLDINLETYTIPLTKENINKYDVFILTNLFGTYPSNLLEWQDICKKNNKILILDNASSPLTEIENININNFGDFSFGSLHHTKFLGFGEGGYIVVDENLYNEFNNIMGFGFDISTTKRIYSKYSSNYKMCDVNAAFIHQHISNYNILTHINVQKEFIKRINDIEEVKIFNYVDGVVYGNLPILFNKPINHLYFKDKNIECNKYYYPLVKHKNSLLLYEKIVNFPLHQKITEYEIDIIVSLIKRSVYEHNNGS